MKQLNLLLLICFSFITLESVETRKKPRLTIAIVIDQFAYHYIPKLAPFLQHGLKFLLRHGIVYENAYYPHAIPSTAPGHTGLSTGTLPKDHGIITNAWYEHGKKISADDQDVQTAAVFSPNGLYNYGKGPAHIMVDGISDQFILSDGPCNPRVSYSISLKSRAAICTANRMGKAIWFDEKTGNFTSSKAYFNELPCWVKQFNREKALDRITSVTWKLAYPCKKMPYCFKNIDNYQYSTRNFSLIGKPMPVNQNAEKPFEFYERNPIANQMLFDLALRCIENNIDRKSCNEMLLWLCLSPLDMVGHEYGPQSREVIDMIYHLDRQLECFMNAVKCLMKRTEVLFVLTADHGISPIPELLRDEGFDIPHHIFHKELMENMNKSFKKLFGFDNMIMHGQSVQYYIDQDLFNKQPKAKQKEIITTIKKELLEHPGIKKVWTYDELQKSWFLPDQIESYFKTQLFEGRSGQIIFQPYPYCPSDEYTAGTAHRTPYEYDTHVPLILYQKGAVENRIIYDKVWTLQLANTLAYLLHIPKPSASTYTMLPGIIDYDPITGEVIQTVVI